MPISRLALKLTWDQQRLNASVIHALSQIRPSRLCMNASRPRAFAQPFAASLSTLLPFCLSFRRRASLLIVNIFILSLTLPFFFPDNASHCHGPAGLGLYPPSIANDIIAGRLADVGWWSV